MNGNPNEQHGTVRLNKLAAYALRRRSTFIRTCRVIITFLLLTQNRKEQVGFLTFTLQ